MNWLPGSDRVLAAATALALSAVLAVSGSLPGRADGGPPGIDGRLVNGGEPLPGGQVSAYRTVDLTVEPVALSKPSGPDGSYNLDLAPGSYYLVASAGNLWAWCGQNPVTVSKEGRSWIGFSLARWSRPAARPAAGDAMEGRLLGKVEKDGAPVEDVTVSLYFDDTDGFRGMGFLQTPPTGPDGTFRMDMIPEGSYYVIARKRDSGRGVGPMMKGDLLSWYRYNPVRVEAGKEMEILLPMTAKRLDKDIHGSGSAEGRPGFEGVVTDAQGSPLAGLHVFAYLKPEMGHHKPAALSSITDEGGRYRIFLPAPGKYYIGARYGYGDNPAPGELFGHYEGTPDHSLTVLSGQYLEGIAIAVERVLIP